MPPLPGGPALTVVGLAGPAWKCSLAGRSTASTGRNRRGTPQVFRGRHVGQCGPTDHATNRAIIAAEAIHNTVATRRAKWSSCGRGSARLGQGMAAIS